MPTGTARESREVRLLPVALQNPSEKQPFPTDIAILLKPVSLQRRPGRNGAAGVEIRRAA